MTFCWSAIVRIALSYTILYYFGVEQFATLKSRLNVTQDHWNWYHSKAWVRFRICLL